VPDRRELRRPRLWMGCGLGFVALVVWLSVTPKPLNAPTVDGFKTGHIAAYLWLMLWFGQVWPAWRARLANAALLWGLGIALEYVQRAIGYRTFSYADMLDDAIGVGLGLVLLLTPLSHLVQRLDAITARILVKSPS
jgi:ABC-type enterobactin transport system permease subunit